MLKLFDERRDLSTGVQLLSSDLLRARKRSLSSSFNALVIWSLSCGTTWIGGGKKSSLRKSTTTPYFALHNQVPPMTFYESHEKKLSCLISLLLYLKTTTWHDKDASSKIYHTFNSSIRSLLVFWTALITPTFSISLFFYSFTIAGASPPNPMFLPELISQGLHHKKRNTTLFSATLRRYDIWTHAATEQWMTLKVMQSRSSSWASKKNAKLWWGYLKAKAYQNQQIAYTLANMWTRQQHS